MWWKIDLSIRSAVHIPQFTELTVHQSTHWRRHSRQLWKGTQELGEIEGNSEYFFRHKYPYHNRVGTHLAAHVNLKCYIEVLSKISQIVKKGACLWRSQQREAPVNNGCWGVWGLVSKACRGDERCRKVGVRMTLVNKWFFNARRNLDTPHRWLNIPRSRQPVWAMLTSLTMLASPMIDRTPTLKCMAL